MSDFRLVKYDLAAGFDAGDIEESRRRYERAVTAMFRLDYARREQVALMVLGEAEGPCSAFHGTWRGSIGSDVIAWWNTGRAES